MDKRRKYLISGLFVMLILNIADIFTTFWNDPTLKSEVNPLFIRFSFSSWGLIALLFVFQLAYSLVFAYHAVIFEGYNFKSSKKSQLDFLIRFTGFVTKGDFTILSLLKNNLKCFLNLLGFYAFWDYCIGKIIIVSHNSMLAYLNSNSTFKTSVAAKKVDIYLNNSQVWDTFFGKGILRYNSYTISNGMKVFENLYYLECLLILFVMCIFIYRKYQFYLQEVTNT